MSVITQKGHTDQHGARQAMQGSGKGRKEERKDGA